MYSATISKVLSKKAINNFKRIDLYTGQLNSYQRLIMALKCAIKMNLAVVMIKSSKC